MKGVELQGELITPELTRSRVQLAASVSKAVVVVVSRSLISKPGSNVRNGGCVRYYR